MSTTYPWATTPVATLPDGADSIAVTPAAILGTWSAWVQVVASAPASGYLTAIAYRTAAVLFTSGILCDIQVGIGATPDSSILGTYRCAVGVNDVGDRGMRIPLPIMQAGIISGQAVSVRMRHGYALNTTPWYIGLEYLPTGYTGENLLSTSQPMQWFPALTQGLSLSATAGWTPGSYGVFSAALPLGIIIAAYSINLGGNHDIATEIDLAVGPDKSEVIIDTVPVYGTQGGTNYIPLWSPLDAAPAASRLVARFATDVVPLYSPRNCIVSVGYFEQPL